MAKNLLAVELDVIYSDIYIGTIHLDFNLEQSLKIYDSLSPGDIHCTVLIDIWLIICKMLSPARFIYSRAWTKPYEKKLIWFTKQWQALAVCWVSDMLD